MNNGLSRGRVPELRTTIGSWLPVHGTGYVLEMQCTTLYAAGLPILVLCNKSLCSLYSMYADVFVESVASLEVARSGRVESPGRTTALGEGGATDGKGLG